MNRYAQSTKDLVLFLVREATATNFYPGRWDTLPTLGNYIEMEDLDDAELAEEAVLRTARKQGW